MGDPEGGGVVRGRGVNHSFSKLIFLNFDKNAKISVFDSEKALHICTFCESSPPRVVFYTQIC